MAYMSAREMLSGLPVKMAIGGEVAAAMPAVRADGAYTDAEAREVYNLIKAGTINAEDAAGFYGATQATVDSAIGTLAAQDAALLAGEASYLADPTQFGNAAQTYQAVLDSGYTVQDALDAGVNPTTINQVFTAPADTPAYGGPAPTATMSAGVQDYYNTVMADDQIDAAERLAMQKIATDQGLSYADIVAGGVSPNILYNTPTAVVPTPVVPTPVVPDPYTPVVPTPNVAPTVYQPLPDNTGVYAAGQPSLNTTFRDSAPRAEVLDANGNVVNFDYTPGASLTSATGSGYNFTPPTVTGRPRSLMSGAQLGRYTGGRSAADLRQLTTGLGNGRTYSDYAGVLENPGSYSGGLSKSQLYSRMRGLDYQRDAQAAADIEASTIRGDINAYLAANPDIKASYEAQKDRLGGQSLEQFARNHYNTTGRAEMDAGKRGLFTLVADTPVYTQGAGMSFGSGRSGFEGDYEGEGEDYVSPNWNSARQLGQAGGAYRPFAHGGSVKKK